MKSLGFKNFRKFENFEPMKFGPITIFVGGNNAGKSTVVKAILSIMDFMSSPYFCADRNDHGKDILNQQFYFNKSYFAHIGTFKRALFNKSKNNVIEFNYELDNVLYTISILGDPNNEEATSGQITKLDMVLLKWNIDLHYDFLADKIHAVFHKSSHPLYDNSNQSKSTTRRCRYLSSVDMDKYFVSVPEKAELTTTISGDSGMIGGSLLDCLIDRFTSKIESTIEFANDTIKRKKWAERYAKIEGLSNEMITFLSQNEEVFSRFGLFEFPYAMQLHDNQLEYIYAHAVTQTITYSAKDTNDYYVKTIHEFASPRIQEDSKTRKFIVKWMKRFNIGENYEILSVGGEAHIVKIVESDSTKVNLADKGIGSIQLMILLFRLATLLLDRFTYKTVIVEEPEQNLHPQLQSKLADLFLEMNKVYGIRFIIETHSEYLIRKTQILVNQEYVSGEKPLSQNPFKVYYFDSKSNKNPYFEMIYQNDGNFSNDFGSGFFDEAANLAFKIL